MAAGKYFKSTHTRGPKMNGSTITSKRRGRPPVPESQRRVVHVRGVVTSAESAEIAVYAGSQGITVSNLLRDLALGAARTSSTQEIRRNKPGQPTPHLTRYPAETRHRNEYPNPGRQQQRTLFQYRTLRPSD